MAVTKNQWVKQGVHEDVTLPSGAKVTIKLPNVSELIKSGQLPNDLIKVATEYVAKGATAELPDDLNDKVAEYNRFLVALTVHEPKITPDDVPSLPAEDLDMIVSFANRQIDIDAVGHHLAGLEAVDSFREFRGL